MQAVRVGWVGQTVALARCNDSRGKKPRSRRTKEERKTMVESFIKKYRNSNNGNFPSLNLTHKEVGGSFYTIREIVREIIQENKVLGPGSSSLQVLNLDHYLEQQSLESLSLEPLGHSSSSTMVHATDAKQKEILSFPSEHQSMSEATMPTLSEQSDSESIELLKCDIQETFESHSNEIFISQSIDGKSAGYQEQILNNGRYLNGNWTNEECKEAGQIKPLEQGQNDSRGENYKVKPPVRLSRTVSRTSTSDVSIAKNFEIDMQSNSTNMEIISAERDAVSKSAAADISDAKILTTMETKDISDQLQDQSSVHNKKTFPSPSFASLTFDSDQSSAETEGFGSSEEMEINVSTNEHEVASLPAYLDSTGNRVGPAESFTSGIFDVKTVARLKTTTNSEKIDHSTSAITKVEELSILPSNDSHRGNIITNVEKDFGQASSPVEAEANISSTHAASDLILEEKGSKSSEDANEKSEMMEANPVLSFFKGLVTAFIKFWVE